MKQIPCLDSDFPEWDWENAVNNVTDDYHIQLAYTAITSGGLTLDFTVAAWNSLVTWLQKVYKTADLDWDSTYGDANSLKMTYADDDRILTAKRWNAIVKNISNEISTVWPWENEPSKLGYTGRRFMQSNDFLYGWYILELVAEINRLIKIGKGEADIVKVVASAPSMTSVDATLTSAIAGLMAYTGNIKVPILADLQGCPGGIMEANTQAITSYHADLEVYRAVLLESTYCEVTKTFAKLQAAQAGEMVYQDSSSTNVYADLLGVPYIGKLATQTIAQSLTYAELMAGMPLHMSGKSISNDTVHAVLSAVLPCLLTGSDILHSQTHAELIPVEPKLLTADSTSRSSLSADLQAYQAGALSSLVDERTQIYARLKAFRAGLLYTMIKSGTTHYADLVSPQAGVMEAIVQCGTRINAKLTGAIAGQMIAKDSSASIEHADLIRIRPVYIESHVVSHSTESVELTLVEPVLLTGTAQESTATSAELAIRPAKQMDAQAKSQSRVNAQMIRRPAKPVAATATSGTLVYAKLTLIKETNWIDPVQTGTNVHIYSAYPHQTGTNIRLGKEKDNG